MAALTYSATIRPGLPDEELVDGLDSAGLDKWLTEHGSVADRFTYSSIDGTTVVVRGEGVIDHLGDPAYKVRS